MLCYRGQPRHLLILQPTGRSCRSIQSSNRRGFKAIWYHARRVRKASGLLPPKEAGFLEMAVELANQSPCDPELTRAARDVLETNPVFALEAGLAALRWLAANFGYEVTGADVWAAYSHTINAAERVSRREQVRQQISHTGGQQPLHNGGCSAGNSDSFEGNYREGSQGRASNG